MAFPIILSSNQAAILLTARQLQPMSVRISADLGLTTSEVGMSLAGVLFPSGEQISWETITQISLSQNKCFVVTPAEFYEIRTFSNYTNRVYSLFPTAGAPTMLISGIPMHRIKDTEPHQDTLQKIKTVAPVVGRVLDTATGLGYTAIEAARTAEDVITIELDPAASEVARLNPWSRELFSNPKITRMIGDSFEEVQKLADKSFSRIIHDPPTLSLAGDLYSEVFYQELNRILKPGGKVFHYIGDPDSKSGSNTTRGVIRRLHEAGFSQVFPKPKAFGVVALK